MAGAVRSWRYGSLARPLPVTTESSQTASPGPADDEGAGGRPPSRWHRWVPKPLRRVVKLLLFAFVLQYLVLPQIKGTRKAIDVLGTVRVTYLIAGLGLEMAAIVAYAVLTRAVLPGKGSPSLLTLLRIQLTTLAVSHVVPGGTAAGSSLGYRLLTGAGVDGPDAGFALATQGLGSAVVLNAILWIALIISIPFYGFNPLYITAAVVGVLAIGAFSVLIILLTRRRGTLGPTAGGAGLEGSVRRLLGGEPARSPAGQPDP